MAPFHGPELSLLSPISTKPLRARNSVHSQTGASVSFLLGYYHTIYTWWFFCFKAPSWLGAWTSPNKALWKASFYLFIISHLSFLSTNLSISFIIYTYTLGSCYAIPIMTDCTLKPDRTSSHFSSGHCIAGASEGTPSAGTPGRRAAKKLRRCRSSGHSEASMQPIPEQAWLHQGC